jgi:hypothetical protein
VNVCKPNYIDRIGDVGIFWTVGRRNETFSFSVGIEKKLLKMSGAVFFFSFSDALFTVFLFDGSTFISCERFRNHNPSHNIANQIMFF